VTTCVVVPADTADIKRGPKLSGDAQKAWEVLCDLIAERGDTGYAAAPQGVRSVPEGWWRDRFKERAKAGASDDAKQKAFRRAADTLDRLRVIGQDKGRVWITEAQ
jgi:hypothetical protein